MMAGADTCGRGGYEHSFIDPPDELMCMICHHVVREAHQVECCGKVFCKACIKEVNLRMGRCPNCRKASPKIFSDLRSSRDVKRLRVACENEEKGCNWSGPLESYEEHVKSECRFAEVPCPNCGDRLWKGFLEEHTSNRCPKRVEECTVCHELVAHENMPLHVDVCPKVEIECMNSGCSVKIFREHLTVHENVCPKQVIACPYIEAGCSISILREDKYKHLQENLEQHAIIASGKVKSLTNMLAIVRQQLTKSVEAKWTPPVTFKMTNYEQLKRNKETWTSPSFYSHPGGYKMFFKVRGDSSNRYLSLFVQLTAGCNDDHLTWPYSGVVTVQILNQVSDAIHYERSIDFGKASEEKRQKPNPGTMTAGFGNKQYISWLNLELTVYDTSSASDSEYGLSERTLKRSYVQGDCIFFHVSEVTATSICRPWLRCANNH